MTDIKITSSTIYPEKHVGGLPVATPGYDIKCVFTVENRESRLHAAVWWTIHDRVADKRFDSGTQAMAPGSVLNILRYVTMPSKPIKLEFWAGFIDDAGVWRYTDSKKFREVTPLITKGSIGISSFPTGAKAYVDATYVGVTPKAVSRDAGSYMVLVRKDGYVDPPVQTVIVAPGAAAHAPFILVREVPVPKLCYPSISGISVPDSIPVTLPSIGTMPTVDVTSFPVSFSVGGTCPSAQFPLDIILSAAGQEISGSATQGSNRIAIASTVRSVLQMKRLDELAGMAGIAISLKYPSKIEYSSPGTVKEWKTVHAYTRLNVTDIRKPECVLTAADYFTCLDGTRIQLNKCVNGVKVPTGETCPTPTPALMRKTVHITTPSITRVGKKTDIVAFVYSDGEKSSGEEAHVTIDGRTLTTTRTRDGKVTASWNPVKPWLYTICVTVAPASACTYLRVVSELSPPEIEAAEEEFEKSKERIGKVMERI